MKNKLDDIMKNLEDVRHYSYGLGMPGYNVIGKEIENLERLRPYIKTDVDEKKIELADRFMKEEYHAYKTMSGRYAIEFTLDKDTYEALIQQIKGMQG